MKALLLALLLPLTADAGLPPTSVQGSAGGGYGTTFQFNFPYIPVTQTGVNASFGQIPLATGVSGNLPVTNLNSGTSAGATTFWRGDGSWAVPAGTVYSFGAFGSTPNLNGGSISGSTITLQPADATNPGGVSTTTQTLAGAKSFSSTPTFSTMTVGSVLFAGTSGILAQDNANFFWDATNHRLGLGTASPASSLTIKNGPDDNVHGIRFLPTSGSEFFDLYTSGTATLQLRDPFQNVGLWQVNNQGRMAVAGASIGHPDATFLVENQPGATTIPAYAAKKQTSQTADFLDFYDTDETTVLFGVSIAGKMSATNINDSALGAGVVHSDASGNFTSSSVANADLTNPATTVNGQTCTLGSTCTVHDASAVTAVSVASANGFAGSSSGGATPALTVSTSVTGVLKGNGTAISAATSGTDYSAGTSALSTGILKSTTATGALTIAASGTDYQAPISTNAGTSHQFFNSFTAPNTFGGAQPAFTDILGVATPAQQSGARTINAQTGTTYTFVLADGANAGGFPLVTLSNASAITATVPPNSSVAYPVGDQIDSCQIGAGKVTYAAGAGVTISSKGSNLSAGGQYVCNSLFKTATNTWILIGDLIADVLRMLGLKIYA